MKLRDTKGTEFVYDDRLFWMMFVRDDISSEAFDSELTQDIVREAGQQGVTLVPPLEVLEKAKSA